jgi:biotin transport system substrate-specific component
MNVRFNAADAVHGTLIATRASRAEMGTAIRVASVVLVAAMTAAAAQVSIPLPFTPVPFTLQPMVVLLGGAALGSRLGMCAQVLYLLAGIAGLPVFAASAVLPQGPLRLLGPTGGYLMSYPFAAFLAGLLAERGLDRRYLTSVLAMAAGLAVIFTFGVLWLAWFARPAAGNLDQALRTGLYPFIPADIVKIFAAAAVMPTLWKLTGGRGRTSNL